MTTTRVDSRQRALSAVARQWPVLIPVALAVLFIVPFRFGGYLDLPNHMARSFIMLTCWRSPAAAVCASYHILPVPLPNMGADLVLVGALAMFPPLVAEQAAMLALLILYIWGWHALFRRVHGSTSLAYVVGLAVVMNHYLYMGFFAYNLSIALALLWLAYWWPRRDVRTWRTTAALIAGMAVVFTAHLAGFLMIFLVYMGYDFHHHVFERRSLSGWISSLPAASPMLLTFASLYFFQQAFSRSANMETFYNPGLPHGASFGDVVLDKIQMTGLSLVGYSVPVDLAVLGVAVAGLVAAWILARQKAPNGFWLFTGAALYLGYLITPRDAFDVYLFDVRFLMMAFFAVLLGVGRVTANRWISGVVVGAMLAGFANTLAARARSQPRLAAAYAAIDLVPPGKRLIGLNSVENFPDQASRVIPFSHFAKYYVLAGHGEVGGVFDCLLNRNLAYFCATDSVLAAPRHYALYEGKGVPALDQRDATFFRANYDYIFIVQEQAQQPVNLGVLADSGFQVVGEFPGVAVLRNTARTSPPEERPSQH